MLQQGIEQLAGDLAELLSWLLSGQQPTEEELRDLADQAGFRWRIHPIRPGGMPAGCSSCLTGISLKMCLKCCGNFLAQQGMDPQAIEQLKQQAAENQQILREQLEEIAGESIRDNMADQWRERRPRRPMI